MQIEIKKLPQSEIEIIGEISAGDFEAEKERAVKELSEGAKIDGFRPGNIPEKILIDKIGEGALLEKMAEMSLRKAYRKIIEENKIFAIGHPEITITKIAKNNPLGFKIKTAIIPEIELLDYKQIAKKVNEKKEEEIAVEDKEVEQTIEYLRKSRLPADRQGAAKNDKGESVAADLPELTDEFVKTLGEFEDVADFKKKIGENILTDKKIKARENKRIEILGKIVESIKIDAPKALVEAEKNKMLHETKSKISQMGMKWEDYLGQIKKTEAEILESWEEDALKRIKHGLVLNEIAKVEKTTVPEEELNKEIEKIISYYKEAGQNLDRSRVEDYTYNILRNEKVFQLLESC